LPELGIPQCNVRVNGTFLTACDDEVICRMFLCTRCRTQVLVCRRCDRDQIYCMGDCARDVRREGQREARRRYQATPHGRATHAERNRRYRARVGRVTDHGLTREHDTGRLRGSRAVRAGLSEPSPGGSSPRHYCCHHCGWPTSTFLRLVALRPTGRRGGKAQIRHRGRRSDRPP
jgi:hypothetical protein